MAIITTILFLVMPIMVIPLIMIGLIKDSKHSLVYSILMALYFGIMAYNLIPDESMDLYRYFYWMKYQYANMNLTEYMQIFWTNNKIVFTFLLFIVSHMQNYHLLPFFCIWMAYTIVFYTITDFAKTNNIKPIYTIFVLIASMSIIRFVDWCSGLAQFLAIVIVFLAIYLELIKGKKGWQYKLLYVVGLLIHSSVAILIIFRLLILLNQKKYLPALIIIFIIYSMAPVLLTYVLKAFSGVPIIGELLVKAEWYTIKANNIFSFPYHVVMYIFTIFYLVLYACSKKYRENTINNKYCDYILIILLFTLASWRYFDIFMRFTNLNILLMNIYILWYLNRNEKVGNTFVILVIFLFIVVLIPTNVHVIQANNFNDIFRNLDNNIFYFLDKTNRT